MSNAMGVAVSFAAAFCWGMLYAQVQTLDRTIPPFALLSVAYIAGAAVLSPIAVRDRQILTKAIKADPKDFVACLLALLAAEGLIFYSIDLLGGTEASLIEVSYPLWTALLLFITIGERPSKATKVGGALIMLGVIIIIVADEQRSKP